MEPPQQSANEGSAPSASDPSYNPEPPKRRRRSSRKNRSPRLVVDWVTRQAAVEGFEYKDEWAQEQLAALKARTTQLADWTPPENEAKRRALFYNNSPKQRERRKSLLAPAKHQDQEPTPPGTLCLLGASEPAIVQEHCSLHMASGNAVQQILPLRCACIW